MSVLIEKDLPIEELNPVAMGEGNSKKPVYQMHKWWARRLGSVFRAIILSALDGHNQSPHSIWERFCEGTNLGGKIVLDPFMGGGTTIVEALRLGCKVVGTDINPVAWFVTKKEVEPVDLDTLDRAFEDLKKTAGGYIKNYYQTTCPCGHNSEVMYFFWVKVAECQECGALSKLFPNYEISLRDHTYVCVCPRCLDVIETTSYQSKTRCKNCNVFFDPRKGISGRGVFTCAKCGSLNKILDVVARKGAVLDLELFGLEGYCKTCGRFFKKVDEDDISLWKKAKREYRRCHDKLFIPNQAIPAQGRSDPRPVNHGYTHFKHLFNERQLLCLSKLLEQILKLPDQNVRELMLVAFSDCLDANNMFCKYEAQWHKISPFFGLHAYHPIERPTENNVWGAEYGRCTFVKCFEKVRRAKEFCKYPYERLRDSRGIRFSKQTGNERIEGRLVETFVELKKHDKSALLKCQGAENLSFLPAKSVDAVITDPPYFDNVQYSELADFFYVWLRIGLKDSYAWFEPELSSRPQEIVKNEKQGKTIEYFNERLLEVFKECHRVLKDSGVLVFTFHHNKTWAWKGIAQILLEANFYVSASPIVRSEGKSGFHSSKGNIRYDCIFVCRKRPSEWQGKRWPSLRHYILKDSIYWARRTLQSGMPINEVDVFTIVLGKTVEFYTKAYPRISYNNKPFTLAMAIEEMKDFVEHVSGKVQPGPGRLVKPYKDGIEQLSLFIREAKAEYSRYKPGNARLI